MAVSFNETAAKMAKEASVQEGFTYDTITDGGCLNKFDEVGKLISDISTNIETIGGLYTTLQGMYNAFTDFNETMNTNKTGLRNSIDDIKKGYDQILESLKTQVGALQQNDATLMSDLEGIDKMISNSQTQDQLLAETRNKNDAVTPEQAAQQPTGGAEQPTGSAEQPVNEAEQPKEEEPTNTSKTDEEINQAVDDVMKGKYGTGEERKKALEEAGFDPAEVQKRVNDKINGTSSSNDESTATPEVPQGESVPVEPTANQTSEGYQPTSTPTQEGTQPTTAPTQEETQPIVRPDTPKGGSEQAGFIMPNSSQMEEILQIIYKEGGVNPTEACNIASTMINRARSSKWSDYGGNDVYKQATFPSQFVSVGPTSQAQVTPEVRAAVTELFNNAYNGGGTSHNYDSFRSNDSVDYGGTILVEGGNRYK